MSVVTGATLYKTSLASDARRARAQHAHRVTRRHVHTGTALARQWIHGGFDRHARAAVERVARAGRQVVLGVGAAAAIKVPAARVDARARLVDRAGMRAIVEVG